MTITAADIDRIRAVAEADKNGTDGKAWDETVTPDVVIALCDHITEAIIREDQAYDDLEKAQELAERNERSKFLLVGAIFDAAVGAEMAEMAEGQKAKDIPRIMRDEILKLRRERDEWKTLAEKQGRRIRNDGE